MQIIYCMILNYTNEKTTEAVIYLKNGKKKFGILVDENPFNENFHFIQNNNILHFNESQNTDYIEIIPGALIEAIETDLR
jgi:hypothetical protein